MESNSLVLENVILRSRKNRATPTFSPMLMRMYGPTAMRRSTKFSRILSVYVPSNAFRMEVTMSMVLPEYERGVVKYDHRSL
jgi:hypothetical protein